VPTPFYHLSLAQEISEHPGLDPALRNLLQANGGAFLLGNTAPDIQVLSGQDRLATHFFSVPIPPGGQVPWVKMLLKYPELNQPADLIPARAAFIAGYLCHLQADWIWVLDIFQPVFGPYQTWSTFSNRLFLHNVLRAYLDDKVISALPADVAEKLHPIHPHDWLPFAQDSFLTKWRNYLCEQLQPGKRIETIDVFASRHGINPAAFQTMINSEERMEKNVFVHLSRPQLREYRERLVAQNIELLELYLSDITHSRNRISNSNHYYRRSSA
jgi:hypothetical protein